MFLRIADMAFEITTPFKLLEDMCKEYACDAPAHVDAVISIDKTDVMREYDLAKLDGATCTIEGLAFTAIYRKICAVALKNDAFVMHGIVIEYKGKGYLFSAKSGIGKTTHVFQWKKAFGEDNVTIVNGDKPIIRIIDGKVYAYGTPWCGKEGYNKNMRVELAGICFLERAQENSICKISDSDAAVLCLEQVMIGDSVDLPRQLELVDSLIEKVPAYVLKCNISTEAAEVAYGGMNS